MSELQDYAETPPATLLEADAFAPLKARNAVAALDTAAAAYVAYADAVDAAYDTADPA